MEGRKVRGDEGWLLSLLNKHSSLLRSKGNRRNKVSHVTLLPASGEDKGGCQLFFSAPYGDSTHPNLPSSGKEL